MALKIKDMPNVANFTVAACSLVGGPVAVAGGVLGLLTAGKVLLDCVQKNKRKTLQTSIKEVQKACAEEAARIALVQGVPQDELDEVWGALNEAVYHTGASHADIVRWNYEPETVATRMLERLAEKNELFKISEFASELAKGVLFQAFTAVRTTEGYLKNTEAYFRTELLTKVDAIDWKVEAIYQKMFGDDPQPIDEQSKTSIEQTIKGLITAQEGARKRAGDKLKANPPDPQGAKIELLQLAAQGEDNVQDLARTYLDIGNIAFLNDTHEALEVYLRVTELTPNDPEGWTQAGRLQQRLGELAQAETSYQKVLALADKYNDKDWEAVASNHLGKVEQIRGHLGEAATYYQQSLKLNKQLDRKGGMADNYGNLGIVEQIRGNLDEAVDYYHKSLTLEKQLGRKQGMARDYGNLGIVAKTRGNFDAAVDYYHLALEIDEELDRKENMANQYGNLGIVEEIRGNLDEAEDYHHKSLVLNEQLGRKENMAIDYGNLGIVEQTRGNLDAAVGYYHKSLKLNKMFGFNEGMAHQYGNLGRLEADSGNLDAACGLWRQAYDLFVQIGAKLEIEEVGGWMREAGCADAPKAD